MIRDDQEMEATLAARGKSRFARRDILFSSGNTSGRLPIPDFCHGLLERIRQFQAQLAHLRKLEYNPVNYRLSASGFLAEIDRMQLEVREYPSLHTVEVAASV